MPDFNEDDAGAVDEIYENETVVVSEAVGIGAEDNVDLSSISIARVLLNQIKTSKHVY